MKTVAVPPRIKILLAAGQVVERQGLTMVSAREVSQRAYVLILIVWPQGYVGRRELAKL